MIQIHGKHFCEECQIEEVEKVQCECGACLYRNGEQIPDPMYPFFRCTRCNKNHFWD